MSGHSLSPGKPCGVVREGTFAEREVHVWECCLAAGDEALVRFHAMLSEDELRRASRFHFQRERRRYTAARGMLREILSRYLGRDPGELGFCRGNFGKPRLSLEPNEPDIRFSLSRSGDLALVAVAAGMEIGVDIEYMKPDLAVSEVARNSCCANEIEKLASLDANRQREAFFRCWTRKEAFLKGKGVGLLQDPKVFEVSLLHGEPAALLDFPPSPQDAESWTLFDLPSAGRHAASLAIRARGARIVCRKWGGGWGDFSKQ